MDSLEVMESLLLFILRMRELSTSKPFLKSSALSKVAAASFLSLGTYMNDCSLEHGKVTNGRQGDEADQAKSYLALKR